MSSLGIRGSGGGLVPILQKEWTAAVENSLQAHEDKADVLRGVVEGASQGVEAAIGRARPLALTAAAALALIALSTAAIAVTQVLALFRPIAEVIR